MSQTAGDAPGRMSMSQAETGKIRYKSFRYTTSIQWGGRRSGTMFADGKPEIRISSPPEFKGESGIWSPEDLFVAAVNSCTMTTFLALASRLEIPLEMYVSDAEGSLEFVDGNYQFTRVVVRPTIIVSDEATVDAATRAIFEAHEKCLIANSIRAEVLIEAKVEVAAIADLALT